MKKWLIGIAVAVVAILGVVYYLGVRYAHRIEPYIRQQAVTYLEQRFNANVEMAGINIDLPRFSPIDLYMKKGRGAVAHVVAHGITMRHKAHPEAPPMFKMRSVRFEVDIGRMFEANRTVNRVLLDGMEITVPPRRPKPVVAEAPASKNLMKSRPPTALPDKKPAPSPDSPPPNTMPSIAIAEVVIANAKLVILPKDASKKPLEFDLNRIFLKTAGLNKPMSYDAQIINAKPPGEVKAVGSFGPWNSAEPGDTFLNGDYTFERADLGVFKAIGGILHSTGKFRGSLSAIDAEGEATVPDFYLKMSGNRMLLKTSFEAQVDGTNGNTVLKPVKAQLGQTHFTTSGGIIRHEGDRRKTIDLDVDVPAGRLEDFLKLAMKGDAPFMSGILNMKSRVAIPPLDAKVKEKLRLNGRFVIKDGKFLRSQMQDRIDKMSRQAQGDPKNEEIDEVVSVMSGKFNMADESITLNDLKFAIPGADMALDGTYGLDTEVLDFHGQLRLKARLSQTQSGWKRWALKPVDPFFAKNGAGTFVKIKIQGTRKEPKFGRE